MQDKVPTSAEDAPTLTETEQPAVDREPASVVLVDRPLRSAVIGIFLLSLAAAFFFAKTFLLPVFIAVLLALVLVVTAIVLRRRSTTPLRLLRTLRPQIIAAVPVAVAGIAAGRALPLESRAGALFGTAVLAIALLGPVLTLLPTLVLTRKYLKV